MLVSCLQSFPKIAYPMATHIRRFVTSPQPIFESEFPFGTQTPPPLIAAARCLVLCIEVSEGRISLGAIIPLIFLSILQLAPGDDAMLSHTYSLLNYIAATSRFSGVDGMSNVIQGTDGQTDYATLHSVESALRGLTEEEKRLIAVSTISVVTRLAVEFDTDEVCSDLSVLINMITRYFSSGNTIDGFDVAATPAICGTNR